MRQRSRAKQRPCYRQGLFSVIGGLSNPPFISAVARVAWDNVPCAPVETADPVRVPAQHAGTGERLSLFADGIARGESFETGDGSFCVVQRFHSLPYKFPGCKTRNVVYSCPCVTPGYCCSRAFVPARIPAMSG